jgi:hypothetical protein
MCEIMDGTWINQPGWVRISIHPTMTDAEVHTIVEAIKWIADNREECKRSYRPIGASKEFESVLPTLVESVNVSSWFTDL